MRTVTIDESAKFDAGSVGVTITAEPLEIVIDETELGRIPADAIARAISAGIENIAAQASAATIAKRRAQGISSTKLFNATGELSRGIRSDFTPDGAYEVSAPADRLQDPDVAARLVELVPALQDPIQPSVQAAIEATADAMIKTRA